MRAPPRRDSWPTANLAAASPSHEGSQHFDFATQTVLTSPSAAPAGPATPSGRHGQDALAQRENQMLSEYALLAQACHRGGKVRGEAFNSFCLGVLHDNRQEYAQAIPYYETFLKLCQHSQDPQGEMLALNAIGVAYQQRGLEYYGDAAHYHSRHLDSPYLNDKFVAHTNLGLVFAALGQPAEAAVHHQHALRYAIRLGSVPSQSIAIGNLGLTGSASQDFVTAKACMERYLELSSSLQDVEGLSNAHHTLGHIAAEQGEFPQASDHFQAAMRTSQAVGNTKLHAATKVNLGVAAANASLDEQMRRVAAAVVARAPAKLDWEEAESDDD